MTGTVYLYLKQNESPMNILKYKLIALAALFFLFSHLSIIMTSQAQENTDMPIYQMRIYEIFDHNKQAFHDRFRDHAHRIMKRYDFNIISMWEASGQGQTEFVYILEWPDEKIMNTQWEKFMADKEWDEIKKQSLEEVGATVGAIESRIMRKTAYSP